MTDLAQLEEWRDALLRARYAGLRNPTKLPAEFLTRAPCDVEALKLARKNVPLPRKKTMHLRSSSEIDIPGSYGICSRL